jgi:hypothetical protein
MTGAALSHLLEKQDGIGYAPLDAGHYNGRRNQII